MRDENQIGTTLTKHFTCSTSCIVQSFQGFATDPSKLIVSSSVMIAALSRSLKTEYVTFW